LEKAKRMDRLNQAISDAVYILREAAARYERVAVLWSMGKDSTLLLWLCRKAFLGRVPFPVIHVDTGRKLPQMYAFRDRIAADWDLDLRIQRNEAALEAGVSPETHTVLECCHALKTTALKQAIERFEIQAVLLGIRRDEHGVRAKERVFSPRFDDSLWTVGQQPPELWDLYASVADADHDRVHPMLHLTERDVWEITAREGVPVNPLYFSRDGWRFRSLGCAPCCVPIPSEAGNLGEIIEEIVSSETPERAGRAQDKEAAFTMQKLRSLGYM